MMNPGHMCKAFERLSGPSRLQFLVVHQGLTGLGELFRGNTDVGRIRKFLGRFESVNSELARAQASGFLPFGKLPGSCASITLRHGYGDRSFMTKPMREEIDVPVICLETTHFGDGGCMFTDTVGGSVRNTTCDGTQLDFPDMTQLSICSVGDRLRLCDELIYAASDLDFHVRERAAQRSHDEV